jgi:hypothetical protein
LDQVEEGEPLVAVVLGHGDDQAQVGLDHLLLGPHVAALDALGQVHLLLGGEQADPAQVAQEQLKRVGGHVGAGPGRRGRARRGGRRVGRSGVLLGHGDLPAGEEAAELLALALVETEVADRVLDLRRRQDAEAVALSDQGSHLFELLDFGRHGSDQDTPIHLRSGSGAQRGGSRPKGTRRPGARRGAISARRRRAAGRRRQASR